MMGRDSTAKEIGGLVVSHGNLAHELVAAARKIGGSSPISIQALTLEWDDSVEDAKGKLADAIRKLGNCDGVIIFTDMFGGTPSNIALSFFEQDRVEIVTGVNLPMVIKFCSLKREGLGLGEVARAIQDRGARSIRVASDILAARPGEN